MTIKEAAEQAVKLGLGMWRRNDEWPPWLIVFPTDTADCCVLESEFEGEKSRRRGWEPYADDLIAEDWELAEKLDGKESSDDDAERARRLIRRLNGDFNGKDLTVSVHYVP